MEVWVWAEGTEARAGVEATSGMRCLWYWRPFKVLARVAVGWWPGLGCLHVAEVWES